MTQNNQAPDPGIEFDVEPQEIGELAYELSFAEHTDCDDPEKLAKYVRALKNLEKAVEDARKDVFEELLDEHVGVGESFGGLRRVSRSRRYVSDTGRVFAALEEKGIDPTRVVSSISVSEVEDIFGIDAQEFIEATEYDYYTPEDQ